MMNLISLIEKYECPLVNAIFFPNGDMLVLNNNNNKFIEVVCKSTIQSFFTYNDEDSVCCYDILKEYDFGEYILKIGEGSYGSDGIVQLYDKNKSLLWFLFLDNSNPFIEGKIYNNNVQVISSSNVCFSIPINRPDKLYIQG